MDAGSIERLELRAGEKVTAAHVAALDRSISKNAGLPGVGVRRKVFPWGTTYSYHGTGGGGGSAPVFAPQVEIIDRDTAAVRWDGPRALIGGVAPTIDAKEIFETLPETGLRPALLVTRGQFGPLGECGIYFRVTVGGDDFSARTVIPVAAPTLPSREAHQADCLALFLRLRAGIVSYEEDDDRELFSAQGFLAINRRASGIFEPLFWARF